MSRSAYGLSTPTDDSWLERARCRKEDPELFFREGALAIAEALHICWAHCPVRVECRREARARPPVSAVQGGEYYPISGKRPGPGRVKPAERCHRCWPERPLHPTRDTGACGQPKGYERHVRRAQQPCEACREAKRADYRRRAELFKEGQ